LLMMQRLVVRRSFSEGGPVDRISFGWQASCFLF